MNTDTPVRELGTVYAPPEMFSFHEYAFGCTHSFYEGDPNARIETGSFSGEEEDA